MESVGDTIMLFLAILNACLLVLSIIYMAPVYVFVLNGVASIMCFLAFLSRRS